MDAEEWSVAESEQIRRDAQADAADEAEQDEQVDLLTEFVNYLQDSGYQITVEECRRIPGHVSDWTYNHVPADANVLQAMIHSFLRDRALVDIVEGQARP